MGRGKLRKESEAGYVLLDVLVGFAVLAIGAAGIYFAARNISANVERIRENTAYISELEASIVEKSAQFVPVQEAAE